MLHIYPGASSLPHILAKMSAQLLHRTESGSPVLKTGMLEKYSVGRGFFPVKNWQRRFFIVTYRGLNYSKGPQLPASTRTFVPFASAGDSEVRILPVFLFPCMTPQLHPAATDPGMFYFAIGFEERDNSRMLLMRTPSTEERDDWVRFIGQFVHAAGRSGVSQSHPLNSRHRVFDPEELDPREKTMLRRNVLEWDDGMRTAVQGGVTMDPVADVPPNWDSDEEPDDGALEADEEAPIATKEHSRGPSPRPSAEAGSRRNSRNPKTEEDDDIL